VEKEMKEAEAKEKPEGEEALNKLFQEIYGKGSDEVKRAMNKSYMESGGTVLSTNWNEISKDKVEVKPPDGMEWKKW
jgi:suppressor of G2 allele of SKP1